MADMLNVAVSGLKAFQRALDTTSHNIANATTPGYSRQRVNLVTSEPQAMGALNLGRGVDVSSIDRYYDALLTAQMRGAASGFTRMETYASKAESLNNLFADSTTGLSASMQKFVNALQGVANTPNSTPARQVLLSEGKALVERLQSYDRRLDELEAEINTRLRGEAAAITTAAENIARLNEQIVRVQATTGSPANDLLDARDLELAELARHINVDVVEQGDGAVNVFIGNGQSLVVGQIAAKIVTEPDTFNPTRLSLAYQTGGSTASLKGVLSGGSVGGLLDFRRELLDPVRNELGQIAVGIADAVNAQHREGMDLRGQMGGDFFAIGGVQVLPAQKNSAPGATVTATRTGAADIDSRDYVLQYAGGAWSLRQADTGATVPMDGDGTPGNPFTAAGLSFTVSGTPTDGDQFLLQPTAGAIDGLRVLVTDPASIAAAAPIRASAAATNTGSGTISAGEVLDVGSGLAPATIQFIDATHYSVNGAGSFDYVPGDPIDINGYRVRIEGAPAAGDTFSIGSNAGGVGDNRNALELAAVMGKGVLAGGTESLDQASSRLIGRIGVATSQAQTSRDAQQVVYDDTVAAREAVSGVNLDEEAANMLRYQQAYQAAAQMIRISQELFDALMGATGR
jgi:flagellar hook-associated protein 1 FlgK